MLFPLISEMRRGCPPSSFLFNLVLEVLVSERKQGKEIKGVSISKEWVKLSTLACNRTTRKFQGVYKKKKKKCLELISEFGKITEYKINISLCYINCIFIYQ